MRTIIFLLFSATFLYSHISFAAGSISDDRRNKEIFDLFDTDHDGYISMAEFKNNQMLVFYLWDRNKDIVLTPDETPLPPDVFARIAGQNSKIDTLEFLNIVDAAFERVDANHDGQLDQQEFAMMRRLIRE